MTEAIAIGYKNGLDLVNRETPLDPKQLPQTRPFSEVDIFAQPIDWPPSNA